MPPAPAKYPFITWTSLGILATILIGRKRSLRDDARRLINQLKPPMEVKGSLPNLNTNRWLIVTNHYSRPGFSAWWITLGIASVIPREMHWIMTAAWRYEDVFRSQIVTPLSRWFLQRVAHTYQCTRMPPMPPHPYDTQQRASAIRAVLHHLDSLERPILGLSPEGADSPSGDLQSPPTGVGRFLSLLAKRGFHMLPVGVFEERGRLCLSFGAPQILPRPYEDPKTREIQMTDLVMHAIAGCLPKQLRGSYA